MNRDEVLRNKIGDLLGIGSFARSDETILTNIRNMRAFSEKLDAIEQAFFMVPGEPDEDFPGEEPEPKCVLNRWGATTEEYVEQFREALAARLRAAVEGDGWMPIESAPRDGREVLASHNSVYRPFAVRFIEGEWMDFQGQFRNPVYWMPLPPPPKEARHGT